MELEVLLEMLDAKAAEAAEAQRHLHAAASVAEAVASAVAPAANGISMALTNHEVAEGDSLAALSTKTPTGASAEWPPITPKVARQYSAAFDRLPTQTTFLGLSSGGTAGASVMCPKVKAAAVKDLLRETGLSHEKLLQICELAPINQEGVTLPQFEVAMHLQVGANCGIPLPDQLPTQLNFAGHQAAADARFRQSQKQRARMAKEDAQHTGKGLAPADMDEDFTVELLDIRPVEEFVPQVITDPPDDPLEVAGGPAACHLQHLSVHPLCRFSAVLV